MYCINYVTILPLSSQSTQSGCALPQRRREDRQRFGSSCIRLQSPCRSCAYLRVALKDKILVKSTLIPKHFFGEFIWHSAQHHATSGLLWGTRLCNLMFGWEQHGQCQNTLVVRSVITVRGRLILALCKVISWHATTLSFAFLLNLRSQYPTANIKQLSLSLWESRTMSKSHHLTVVLALLEIY